MLIEVCAYILYTYVYTETVMQVLTTILPFYLSLWILVYGTKEEYRASAYLPKENKAGRVQIRVYRGPNGKDDLVQWGYFVKQQADF